MKIKTIMRVLFSTIGFSVILTFFSVYELKSIANQMDEMSRIRYESYQAADELRQSSDDLTRLGRTYVVTGDEKYKKMYMDILAIRNGDKPRPKSYHTIYWDLVLNYGDKPKPDGEVIALQRMMEKLGFTSEEFELLAQAKANSDGLVNMEVKAMNAVKGLYANSKGEYVIKGTPDPKMAIDILHSDEYHREKAKIMKPIDTFFQKIEERTYQNLDNSYNIVKNDVLWGITLMVVVLLSAAIGYLIVTRIVTSPIHKISNSLEDFNKNKDLSIRLFYAYDNEIGLIGKAVNKLLDQYQLTIKKITTVNTNIRNISETIKSVSDKSSEISDQKSNELMMVSTAMEEMTTALSSVAESTCQAESYAGKTENEANSGLKVFNKTQTDFSLLDDEFKKTTDIIIELGNESKNVSNVLDVIKSIAEQTNLLALNAAIEAARAGEQGRGFAVVADEVRSLAKRTQDSTVEIESMISALQDKANLSTHTIRNSTAKINDTRQNIETAADALRSIQVSVADTHQLNTTIASATEEQLSVSNEISGSINKIKNLSDDMGDNIAELLPLIEVMISSTNELQESIQHFKS